MRVILRLAKMRNQKGFVLPILIIVSLLILVVVAYFFSPKSIGSLNVKKPNSSLKGEVSKPIISDDAIPSPIAKVISPNIIVFGGENNIILDLPNGFSVISVKNNQTSVAYNNSTFEVFDDVGGAGACSNEDFDNQLCGYTDEKFSNMIIRTWKDKNGVFMLNPQEILIGGYYLNNIIVEKSKPNTIFSSDEIIKWKEALRTIKVGE